MIMHNMCRQQTYSPKVFDQTNHLVVSNQTPHTLGTRLLGSQTTSVAINAWSTLYATESLVSQASNPHVWGSCTDLCPYGDGPCRHLWPSSTFLPTTRVLIGQGYLWIGSHARHRKALVRKNRMPRLEWKSITGMSSSFETRIQLVKANGKAASFTSITSRLFSTCCLSLQSS